MTNPQWLMYLTEDESKEKKPTKQIQKAGSLKEALEIAERIKAQKGNKK